jgi:hypothetical protein
MILHETRGRQTQRLYSIPPLIAGNLIVQFPEVNNRSHRYDYETRRAPSG